MKESFIEKTFNETAEALIKASNLVLDEVLRVENGPCKT